MMKLSVSLFVAALLLLFQSAAFAAGPQVNLSGGEVKHLQASVVIDAPPASVWQTLTDYNNLKNFMPGYEKSRLLGANGSVKTLDIGMRVSRLLPAFNYQARVDENKAAHAISIQRISGDFKAFKASYKLIPLQGGSKTELVYTLTLDLGVGLPGADHVLKSTTEKSLSAVQSHCSAAYRKSVLAAAK